MKGKKHSDETKRKIGLSKIGKPRDEETKKKLSIFRKGKKLEQIVGVEKAMELKRKAKDFIDNRPDLKYQTKGKTYEEIMGKEKAKQRKNKLRELKGEKNPFFGKNHTEKTKNIIREKWTIERREQARQDMINGKANYIASFINREKLSEKLRIWMKDGHAAYMNMFIKNPSKPQTELYNMILFLCPYAIINYPCLNYSIDIAIPFLNLAIEYDEPYWHQDKEADKKRQKKLEEEGWLFLRYEIIPTKEQLLNDVNKILKGE